MTRNDSELVELIKQGQTDLYSDLVEKYQRFVFSIVSRYVRASSVPDVAQEAFLRCFRDLEKLKKGSAFKSWIRVISIRASYDFLRKERYFSHGVVNVEFELDNLRVDEAYENFEGQISRQDACRLLNSIFSYLGPEEKMVLIMLYFEDYSVEEVSELLGWSKANVKIRSYRARMKAQKLARNPKMYNL